MSWVQFDAHLPGLGRWSISDPSQAVGWREGAGLCSDRPRGVTCPPGGVSSTQADGLGVSQRGGEGWLPKTDWGQETGPGRALAVDRVGHCAWAGAHRHVGAQGCPRPQKSGPASCWWGRGCETPSPCLTWRQSWALRPGLKLQSGSSAPAQDRPLRCGLPDSGLFFFFF